MSETEKSKSEKAIEEARAEAEKNRKEGGELKISIDRSKEIEELNLKLATLTKEAEDQKKKVEQLAKEKEDLATEKSNIETEKEQLKGALTTIAEKEFHAKKSVLMERVGKVFTSDDPTRKDIEAKLNDPEHGAENLKGVEFTMDALDKAIAKGKADADAAKVAAEKVAAEKAAADAAKEAAEKAGKAPKGGETATIGGQQTGGSQQTGGATQTGSTLLSSEESWESDVAMIRDLRARAHDPSNPVKRAEAQAVLDEFTRKWLKQVKKDFDEKTGKNVVDTEKEVGKDESVKEMKKVKDMMKGAQ